MRVSVFKLTFVTETLQKTNIAVSFVVSTSLSSDHHNLSKNTPPIVALTSFLWSGNIK